MVTLKKIFNRKRKLLTYEVFCTGLILSSALAPTSLAQQPEMPRKVQEPSEQKLNFETLPSLPEGVSGSFTGSLKNKIIVAGGSRQNSLVASTFSERLHIFNTDTNQWKRSKLPQPMAFGSCTSTSNAVYLVGGLTPEGVSKKVLKVSLSEEENLQVEKMPDLPQPLAMSSAAVLDGKLMVAAGLTSLEPKEFNHRLWRLELDDDQINWSPVKDAAKPGYPKESDPPLEVPGRILASAAAHNGAFHLLGGFALEDSPDGGQEKWKALAGGWRFKPGKQYRPGFFTVQDADIPLGRISTAPVGDSKIAVIGAQGSLRASTVSEVLRAPQVSKTIFFYHSKLDAWSKYGEWPRAKAGVAVTQLEEPFRFERTSNLILVGGLSSEGQLTTSVQKAVISTVRHFSWINWVVIGAYFVVLLFIGRYFSKRKGGEESFFLGGRKVPWLAVAISMQATGASAISFMAIPARTYSTDLLYYGAALCGISGVLLTAFLFFPIFQRLRLVSVYEYLGNRFSPTLRYVASGVFVVMEIAARISIVMLLPAMALSAVTGINLYLAIMVMAVFAIIYTTLGGIEAVIWSDVLQFVVMVGGAMVCLVLIVLKIDGGISEIYSTGMQYKKFNLFDWSWDPAVVGVGYLVITRVAQYIRKLSNQAEMQRPLCTGSIKEAQKAIVGQWFIWVPMGITWFGLGVVLFTFFHSNPEMFAPTLPTDTVFPQFIHTQLPVGLSGLMIAALFAAAMSTIDSGMNSAATVVVHDFYLVFRRIRPSEQQVLRMSRWATVIIGICATGATLIAATMRGDETVWDMFIRAMAVIFGSFPGLFVLGLLTKRGNSAGALLGLIVGIVVTYALPQMVDIHVLYQGGLGLGICLITGYIASILIPVEKDKDLSGLTIFTLFGKEQK